jgi:hypothetical protein
MRRLRFRLRTALLLVLLVALGLWVEGLRQRTAYCLTTAAQYEQWRDGYAHMQQMAQDGVPGYDHPGEGPYYGREARFCVARAGQYREAADRPWVAVPEDPTPVNAPRWRGPWR